LRQALVNEGYNLDFLTAMETGFASGDEGWKNFVDGMESGS
jgi:hypothetical protein